MVVFNDIQRQQTCSTSSVKGNYVEFLFVIFIQQWRMIMETCNLNQNRRHSKKWAQDQYAVTWNTNELIDYLLTTYISTSNMHYILTYYNNVSKEWITKHEVIIQIIKISQLLCWQMIVCKYLTKQCSKKYSMIW